jgi:Arc/MetJ-type ribon-helix-helix transcriptional regulator
VSIESHLGAIEPVTTQIAVRLPDHLVAFLGKCVADGTAKSGAHAVTKALMKYQRQVSAEHDAQIYRAQGDKDPELDAWATYRFPGEDLGLD